MRGSHSRLRSAALRRRIALHEDRRKSDERAIPSRCAIAARVTPCASKVQLSPSFSCSFEGRPLYLPLAFALALQHQRALALLPGGQLLPTFSDRNELLSLCS